MARTVSGTTSPVPNTSNLLCILGIFLALVTEFVSHGNSGAMACVEKGEVVAGQGMVWMVGVANGFHV